MVDLRREFRDILDEFGRAYILVSVDKKRLCTCVDKLTNTAKDKCPICLGTGFIHRAKKVDGRDVVASIPETLPRMIRDKEPAQIAVPSRRFYFKHDVYPKRQDLVIVCDWDGKRPILDDYSEVYEINHSEPKRADDGRIEYFIASTERDPINADIKLKNVIRNTKNEEYLLTVRR
jgi:hypothetical protein